MENDKNSNSTNGLMNEYSRPPGYGYDQPILNHHTIQMGSAVPMQTMIVADDGGAPWSWCSLVTSMIGFFLCPLFGFIGTVMAILSYVDHRNKEFARYRAKKSCACGFGVAAVVVGGIFLLIGFIAICLTIGVEAKLQSFGPY